MSKSILVIDTPESCGECLCFIERDRFDGNEWHSTCRKLRKEVSDYDKPKDCPLKPLPMRAVNIEEVLHNDGLYYIEEIKPTDFDRGFNACLDKILGGKIDE